MKRLLVALALLLPTVASAQSAPAKFPGLQLSTNNMAICIAGSACVRYSGGTSLEVSVSGGPYVAVGQLPNVGPGAGSYPWATGDSLSLDANGRVTAISNVTRTFSAGIGLLGGGTLTADRTFAVDQTFSPTWSGVHTFNAGALKINNAANSFATTLATNATAARVVVFPDASFTVVGQSTTQTLTNKTIDGGSNTLTNIANSSLVNSSLTFPASAPLTGGGTAALGGTATALSCPTCLTGTPSATGDLMYSTAGGQAMAALPDVVVNRVLLSGGVGAPPSYGLVPNAALANGTITVNGVSGQLSVSGSPVALGGTVTITPSSFTVSAGPGVTGGGSLNLGGSTTLSLDQSFSPTWTGVHTFSNYSDFAIVSAPATPSAAVRLFAATRATSLDTLAYQTAAGNQIAVGRDLLIGARNVSGSVLTKGTVVYVNGSSGGLPRIEKALADASMTKLPALGIVPQDIANNANGFIQTRGVLSNFNTSGWAAGDTLYVDATTAGALTNVEPAHPLVSQAVGTVEFVSAGSGSIMVSLVPLNLHELDGINGTSFSIGDGTGSTSRSLRFKNNNTGSLTWTPTATRTLTLPDTTGNLLAAPSLNTNRIPVATSSTTLGDSGLTWSGSTLDATTSAVTLGGTLLTLQWAGGTAKTINVATAGADTAGTALTVVGGGGGIASATGGGTGGTLFTNGANGGAASGALPGGTGGAWQATGGIGGAGAAGAQAGNGGAASVRGGGSGLNNGGGGGIPGTASVRGGTGAAANGASNTNASGGLTQLLGALPGDGSSAAAGGQGGSVQILGQAGGADNGGGAGIGSPILIQPGGGRAGQAGTGNSGATSGAFNVAGTQSGNGGTGLGPNGNGGTGATSASWSWAGNKGGDGGAPAGTGNGGPGGTGSSLTITTGSGGQGAAGTVPGSSGKSGDLTLATAGAGLVQGSNGGAASGDVIIQNGSSTGAATAGSVRIGQANTSAVAIGRAGITTTVTGTLQTAGNLTNDGDSTRDIGTSVSRWNNLYVKTVSAGSAGLTLSGASTSFVFNASGFDIGSAAPLAVGSINATAVSIGKASTTTTLNGNVTIADAKTITESWNGAGSLQIVSTLQNTTASTNPNAPPYTAPPGAGAPQWSPAWELAGHAWGFRPGTVGSAQRASNVVTVATSSAHGYVSSQYVYLYLGDGNFAAGTYGPITVTDTTHFTYAQTAANAGPSGSFNWFDASGLDQSVKVAQALRAVNGKRFQDNLVDVGQAVPEIVYYRPSAPTAGGYAEWFKISPGLPGYNGSTGGNTGGVTIRTVQSDGVTPGSYLQLGPAAGSGGFILADDAGNSLTSYPYNYGGGTTPNGIPYILSASSISPGAVGVAGYSLGHPGNRWFDVFSTRSTTTNIGVGDVATTRWGDQTIAQAGYASAATTGNYGYYQLGGGAKFQAVASVGTITVAPTGGTSTTWNYRVVAVDRSGNATLAGSGSTAAGAASLSPTAYNALSWAAVAGAAYYDVYVTSVSSANWLGATTSATFKDTVGTGGSDGRYGTGTGRVFSVVTAGLGATGGTGTSGLYYVYAVDADGHASAPTVLVSAPTPTAANPVVLTWSPVGGAAKYVIARGSQTGVVGGTDLQSYSNGLANVGPTVIPIGGLVRSGGTTVSVAVNAGHGLRIGDAFTLTSTDPLFAAGPYTVSTVSSATVFTYLSGGTNGASTVSTIYAGPTGVAGTTFADYSFPARTIGTAARNATADVSFDGQLQVTSQAAGQAMIHTGSALSTSAQEAWRDSNGNTHYGIDANGFPTLGSRFELRENWMMNQNIVASGTNTVFTGGLWQYTTTANASGFSLTSGMASNLPIGTGVSINGGTASGNSTRVSSVAQLFLPQNLSNAYFTMDFPMVVASPSSAQTVRIGMANGVIGNTHPAGWYFAHLGSSGNWWCMADDGTTLNPIPTSPATAAVAGVAQMGRIEYYGAASSLGVKTLRFYIDGTLVCSTTSNVYSASGMFFQFYVTATGTVSPTQSAGIGPLLMTYNMVASPLSP